MKNNFSQADRSGQVSHQRRKLLKAAATTAPLIASLRSEQLLAQAVGSLNCAVKTDANVPPDAIDKFTLALDTWVRIGGIRRRQNPQRSWVYLLVDGGQEYWLEEVGGSRIQRDGLQTLIGQEYSLEEVASSGGTELVLSAIQAPPPWWNSATDEEDFYTLVYYDPAGNVSRLGPYPVVTDSGIDNGVTALNGTCLCSVNPGLAADEGVQCGTL